MKYKLIFIITVLVVFCTERLQQTFYVGFFDLYPARVLFILLLPFFSYRIFSNLASKEVKLIFKIIAAYTLVVLLSAINSPDVFYSFKKWLDILTLYSFIFLTYGFLQSCFRNISSDQIFRYFIIAIKAVVLICFFGALFLERQIDDGGSVRNFLGISFTRRISFFADANYFSTFLIMAFSLIFFSHTRNKIFYLALILVAIFLTGSKGGIVSLFLALFFYYRKKIPFAKSNFISYLGIGIIALSLLFVVFKPEESIRKISSLSVFTSETGGETALPRILAWSSGMKQFENSPIFGLGPGNIVNVEKGSGNSQLLSTVRGLGFYGLGEEAIDKLATHSNYLEVLYDQGIIAFSLYLLLIYKILELTRKGAKFHRSKFLGFHIGFSAFFLSTIFISYNPYFLSFLLGSFLYIYDKSLREQILLDSYSSY